jgi:hypothetical protein
MNQTVTINGRNKNPGTYGGKIFPADFIYISVTATASRIVSDMRFDHSWSKYQNNEKDTVH